MINELMSLKPRVNVVERRMLLSPFCFIIRTFTQNGLRPTFSILDYLQRYICYVVAPTITPSRFALKLAWYSLYRSWGTKKTNFSYIISKTQRCPKGKICLLMSYTPGQKFNHASYRLLHKPPLYLVRAVGGAGAGQPTSKNEMFIVMPQTLSTPIYGLCSIVVS